MVARRPRTPLPALVTALTCTLSCSSTPDPTVEAPRLVHEASLLLATSVEGRPIPCTVVGHGARTLLLIATIHGDEAAGTPLLEELLARVDEPDLVPPDTRLVVVPVANPDGYVANRRRNARGVDLNRNFPAQSFDGSTRHGPLPLSEPEAAFLADLVRAYAPERVISFHQPVGCIDYDGPAASLAHRLAAVSPLPVKRLGGRPGSFGSWFGRDLGRPIVTVELPRGAERLSRPESWEVYGALVAEALR